MNIAKLRYSTLLVGIALVIVALLPGGSQLASASVSTPTIQPPTPPNTPAPTDTPLPTDTPAATSIPVTTNTPAAPPPTDTPVLASTRAPQRGKPDPALIKTVNQSTARIGDEVLFTILVTNRGSATADDVVVTDTVPESFDVLQAITTRGLVSHSGQTVSIAIGELREGDEVTITIRARVNQRIGSGGSANSASLTTSSGGDNPTNNTSAAVVAASAPEQAEATATALAAAPTLSPATATTSAAVVAAPLPAPQQLPQTGALDEGLPAAVLLVFGFGLIALSFLVRRRAR